MNSKQKTSFDDEERSILATFEKGEWVSVKNVKRVKERARKCAQYTLEDKDDIDAADAAKEEAIKKGTLSWSAAKEELGLCNIEKNTTVTQSKQRPVSRSKKNNTKS